MFKRLLLAFSITFLLSAYTGVQAQSLSNIHTVDVDKLSDAQVEKIKKEIDSRGFTIDQATELAKMKGASDMQIMKLKNRLNNPITIKRTLPKDSLSVSLNDSVNSLNKLKKQDKIVDEEKSRVFGSSLFNSKNLTFDPSANIPVPSNYTIGIGDELQVTVWGNSQQNYSLIVSKSGTINIPNVGLLNVSGQKYSEVREKILSKLTTIYSEMKGDDPQTFADVTIGLTQSIQVNIVGEVKLPGTYALPGTSSVFNALFLSGGPTDNGSFRNIQVIRDNQVIQTIDVYDYLIRKNLSANITLKSQDVIYIPVYEEQVSTSKGFKRDAIFEMKKGETLADLFEYAGGLASNVSSDKINLKRITPEGYKQITAKLGELSACVIQNGDSLYVNKQNEEFTDGISIEGAIYEPGSYGFKDGMKLSELISQAGGLVENYYANRGLITRLDDKKYPTIIPFDVQEVKEGKADVDLKSEDKVLIKSIFDIGEMKYVKIEGEVMNVGEFKYRQNMTLKDLIYLAGGMKESASEASVEVARRRSYEEASELSSQSVSLFTFQVDRDLHLAEEDKSFILQPYDYVYIRKAPSYEEQKTVTILGEVKYPGKYAISNKNERISDLIQRAGGLTEFAYDDAAYMNRGLDERQKALVRRINSQKENADTDIDMKLEMNQALELQLKNILENPGKEYDYILKEGDVITVPVKKEEIWVNGAVLNPSGLAYEGKSLKKYIDSAGGFDKRAKKHKTFVIYPNGSSASTKGTFHRNYPQVTPGSQIVVPTKPEREKTPASTWVALASTLSSIAISFIALYK